MDDDIFFEGVADPVKSMGAKVAEDKSTTIAEKSKDISANKEDQKKEVKEADKAKDKDVSKVAAAAPAPVSTDESKDTSANKEDHKKEVKEVKGTEKVKEAEKKEVKETDKAKDKDVSKVAAAAPAPVSTDKSKDISTNKEDQKKEVKETDKAKDKDVSKVAAAAPAPVSTDKSKDTSTNKEDQKKEVKETEKSIKKDVSKVAAAAPAPVSTEKSKDISTNKEDQKKEVKEAEEKEVQGTEKKDAKETEKAIKKDVSKVAAAAPAPVSTDKSKDTSTNKEPEKKEVKEDQKKEVKEAEKKEVKEADKVKDKDVSKVATTAPVAVVSAVSSATNKASNLKDSVVKDVKSPSSSDVAVPNNATPLKKLSTVQPSITAVKPITTKADDDYGDMFGDDEVIAKVPKAAAVVKSPIVKAVALTEEDELFGDMTMPTSKPAVPSSVAVITSVGPTQFSEEFDDLFGSDASSFSVIPTKVEGLSGDSKSVTNVKQTTKGGIAPIAPSLSLAAVSSAVGATKESVDEDLDFLSWLGDSTPERAATPTSVVTGTSAAGNSSENLDSAASKSKNTKSKHVSSSEPSVNSPTHAQSKVKAMMDVFFDDLFGGQQRYEETAEQSTPSKARLTSTDFEHKVREMVSSSFVEVDSLRNLLLEGGYVPTQQRAQVWSVLLTGSCSSIDDAELRDTQKLSAMGSDVVNHEQLMIDCEAIVKRDDASTGGPNLQNDLKDILILYCTRREREYNSVMCQMLLPLMLLPSSFSKEAASSCFYSFASEFTPLLSLDSTFQGAAIQTMHSWVRLLVVYHSPAVAHHLDRVLPGWELAACLPASRENSGSEVDMETETATETETETETETQATEGTPDDESCVAVEIDKIVEKESWGIPLQWICGMFSGSTPAEHSCFLYDWALVSGQRYAGEEGIYRVDRVEALTIAHCMLCLPLMPIIALFRRSVLDCSLDGAVLWSFDYYDW